MGELFSSWISSACSPPNPDTLTNSWISFELLFRPRMVSFSVIPLLWGTLPCPCFSFLLGRTLIAEDSASPNFDSLLPLQGHQLPGPTLWHILLGLSLPLYRAAPQALCLGAALCATQLRTLTNSCFCMNTKELDPEYGELCHAHASHLPLLPLANSQRSHGRPNPRL